MIHVIDSARVEGAYAPHITLRFDANSHHALLLAGLVQRLTNSPGQAMATAAHPSEVEQVRREIERLLAAADARGEGYISGSQLLFAALPVVYGPREQSAAWLPGALMGEHPHAAARS